MLLSQRQLRICWALWIGLHLFAWCYQVQEQRAYLVDSHEYEQVAHNLFSAQTLYAGSLEAPLRFDNFTKRPPVYPLLWGLGEKLPGGVFAWLLLQNFLSLLTLWFSLRLLGELRPNATRSLWLWVLILAYPNQWMYANLLMSEILFQAILVGLFWALLRAWQRQSLLHLWLAAACCILAMFTKPVWYLFGIPFLFWVGYWAWHWRRPLAVAIGLIPVLAAGLFMGFNAQRTGYLHFSSIQNLSLHQYSTTQLLLSVHGPELGFRKADESLFRALAKPDYAAQQRSLQAADLAHIGSNPLAYLSLHVRGMLTFILDPGRFDWGHFWGLDAGKSKGLFRAFGSEGFSGLWQGLTQQPLWLWLGLALCLLGNIVKGLALLTLAWAKRIPWPVRLALLGIMAYLLVLTGVSGAARFALPIFPLLLISVGLIIPIAIANKNLAD